MIGKSGVSLLIGHNGVQDKTTLNPANETVARGIYDATTLSAVDADLATGNIKNGITIFGKVGSADVHDISDATAIEAEVITGETFYAVAGGIRTGIMPIVALAPGSSAYPAGYHAGDGGGLPAIDADLATGNIKSGITIFNVAGHTNVRDSSDADLTAAEAPTGKTFYAGGGARKTGTGTKTLNPANEVVAAGYYAATTLSAVDVHLAAANIKSGVNIFGFVGTVVPGAYTELTVAYFQVYPATGTMPSFPEHVNDNNTGNLSTGWAIGQYCEINLGGAFKLTQFRHYGAIANNGDGVWKIQYYDIAGASWEDWVTGIATRATADWSNWDSSGGEISTNKIRLVITTVDSGAGGQSNIAELEVKF